MKNTIKNLSLSAILTTVVVAASPAMASQDVIGGTNLTNIELVVAYDATDVSAQQQQQQQQQQQNREVLADTSIGILLTEGNDQGFDF